MLAAGTRAPDFVLDRLEGGQVSLGEMVAHGPVLLAFYKISCPVCQMALPVLDRISKGSLQVIAISQDDERGTNRFREMFHVSMATLLDRERDDYPASNAFGISHVPAIFVIEQDGIISAASPGFVKSDLEAFGARAGVVAFRPEEKFPEWKAG